MVDPNSVRQVKYVLSLWYINRSKFAETIHNQYEIVIHERIAGIHFGADYRAPIELGI